METQPPRAGWYPDPRGGERWWNGIAWSDSRRAGPGAVPMTAASPKEHIVPASAAAPVLNAPALVGFLISLTGFVFLNGLMLGIPGIVGAIVSVSGISRANRLAVSGTRASGKGLAVVGVLVGLGGALLTWVSAGLLLWLGDAFE